MPATRLSLVHSRRFLRLIVALLRIERGRGHAGFVGDHASRGPGDVDDHGNAHFGSRRHRTQSAGDGPGATYRRSSATSRSRDYARKCRTCGHGVSDGNRGRRIRTIVLCHDQILKRRSTSHSAKGRKRNGHVGGRHDLRHPCIHQPTVAIAVRSAYSLKHPGLDGEICRKGSARDVNTPAGVNGRTETEVLTVASQIAGGGERSTCWIHNSEKGICGPAAICRLKGTNQRKVCRRGSLAGNVSISAGIHRHGETRVLVKA